jgi:hypothetical protein
MKIGSILGLLTFLLSVAILVEVSSDHISGYIYTAVLSPLQNIHGSIWSQGTRTIIRGEEQPWCVTVALTLLLLLLNDPSAVFGSMCCAGQTPG